MDNPDRRAFLRLLSGSALASALPESIARALAVPANRRKGSIEDIEHIVVLVQENRSFDHYFGSLRGVRGFDDPRAATLATGLSVWHQPVAVGQAQGTGHVLPFHPTAPDLGLQFLQDLAHDWTTTHAAWNHGRNDQWVPQKGTTTMAYLTRQDIPYHYALADAFTVCDAYHASVLGPTDPNRYYLWTGCVGNDANGGHGGGPVIDNAEVGYGWTTFPERLQAAGISWTIYQDAGTGLDAAGSWGWTKDPYIGNYGDNSLLYFNQYRNAQPGDPLYDRARVGTRISAGGTLFDTLQHDVRNGTLPQVSWIVAPEAYSEHPNWPSNYGAWYISKVLDALTANPEVWSKTALFITYDENDGFFDHVAPPSAPQSREQGGSTIDTAGEFYPGDPKNPSGPYGLGTRVPMLVISPWSKGGWVNSQVFDHTSILQFIERRFAASHPGLRETNISPWRRAVCGDLTTAFDFSTPSNAAAHLPQTAGYVPPDALKHADYVPAPPTDQAMPLQEPGQRPARALPYQLHVDGGADARTGLFRIVCGNVGNVAACLQVRSAHDDLAPRTYTVGAGQSLSDAWAVATNAAGDYDVSVHGPNGFFRQYKGRVGAAPVASIEVRLRHDPVHCSVDMVMINAGAQSCRATVTDGYNGRAVAYALAAGERITAIWLLTANFGWYALDVAIDTQAGVSYRLAGHVETGRHSMSDPAIGGLREL